MTNWKTYSLSEVVDKGRGISYGIVQPGTFVNDGVPIVKVNNLTERKLSYADVQKVKPEVEAKYQRTKLRGNEILISLVGSLGHVVKVNQEMLGWNVARAVGVLPIAETFDKEWIYWFLKSPLAQNFVHGQATTSVQATLNLKELQELQVAYPEEAYRNKATEILSALDDKIELNRRMNQTLEQMAQTLFRQYFVDGIDEENLPKGWQQGTLANVIDIKHGYAFKGEFFSDDPTENILVTPGNFRIGGGFNTKKYKFYKGAVPEDYILAKDDLVVTMTDLSKDGDTLGYSALVPTIPGKLLLHNQRIGKVIYKLNLPLKFYLYWLMRSDSYRATVLGSASGSTVKHTSPSRILEYKCIIPNAETLLNFEEQVKELYEKEHANQLEIYTLSNLRDTLLPKLMSGEIDVMQTKPSALYEPVLS